MVVSGGLRRPRAAFARLVIACLAALSLAAPARAATARPALQQALDKLVSDGVPGAIALERQDGQEWQAASGGADVTTKRPISPPTGSGSAA